MADITIRPITVWPGEKTPSYAQEKMPGSRRAVAVFAELKREIRLLGADAAVVETFHKARDIRLDGMLRADASLPSYPGVIVYIETKSTGPLRFACDQYQNYRDSGGTVHHGWVDNLRSISMTLEALRGIDRWGVAKSKEQYRGWVALPPPPPEDSPQEKAAKRLLDLADCPIMGETIRQMLNDERYARSVFNQAMKRHHPDVGGDRYKFEEARECWRVLVGLDG